MNENNCKNVIPGSLSLKFVHSGLWTEIRTNASCRISL